MLSILPWLLALINPLLWNRKTMLLYRVTYVVLTTLALAGCLTNKRGASTNSDLRYLKFERPTTWITRSVGGITTKSPNEPGNYGIEANGTGFIVGEDSRFWYGFTNAHVWEDCYGGNLTDPSLCWIAFPRNLEQTQWCFAKVGIQLSMIDGSPMFVKQPMVEFSLLNLDYAVFHIEKSTNPGLDDCQLTKLPIIAQAMSPGVPMQITAFGFPGAAFMPGPPLGISTLVASHGIGWFDDFKHPVTGNAMLNTNSFFSTAQMLPGNSGGPAVTKFSGSDSGQFVAVGVNSRLLTDKMRNSVQIDSLASSSRDVYNMGNLALGFAPLLARFPELSTATYGITIVTSPIVESPELLPITVARHTITRIDGQVFRQFSLSFEGLQIDEGNLFFNGINSKYLEGLRRSQSNSVTSFEIPLRPVESPLSDFFPLLRIELMNSAGDVVQASVCHSRLIAAPVNHIFTADAILTCDRNISSALLNAR
jgi:hypothetical protein